MAVTSSAMRRSEQAAFVSGDVFGGGGAALVNILFLFFLTDVTGLPVAWAGLVVASIRIVDAVAKPVLGQMSDNTRTRWGRRRPFIGLGAVAVIAAMALLWWPHTDGWPVLSHALFALAAAVFYSLAAATVTVGYASLSTDITTDAALRNRLNLTRLAVSLASSSVVTLLATWLIDLYRHGHLSTGGLYAAILGGFGAAFLLPLLAVALLTRERAPLADERPPFSWRPYVDALRLPEFRALLGLYLCQALPMDIVTLVLLAYAAHVVPVVPVVYAAITIGVTLVFYAVSRRFVDRVDKNVIYGRLLPLAVVGMIAVALWPSEHPMLLYPVIVVLGVGIAGSQLMPWVMFPDVVDAAQLAWGTRPAGTFTGMLVCVRSAAAALLVWLVGLGLQAAGYVSSTGGGSGVVQPTGAQWAIRGALVLASTFLVVGWWLSGRYPLTRQRCLHQQALLEEGSPSPQ